MTDFAVDLRSDLLGPRTDAVIQAVASALAEPPTFFTGESPHEAKLIAWTCEMLGLEAGLFLPTCTLANQVAARCWLPQGGSVAGDRLCHLFTTERHGLELMRLDPVVVASEEGHVTPEAAEQYIATATPGSALIWLENTHNMAGGTTAPEGWQGRIARLCQAAGLPLHLDGSRLWNAAAAGDHELRTLAQGASSVALSFNKALGAPMGAVLAGPKAMIEAAAKVRAAMGGEWRPIGPMAAGAAASTEQWRERLRRDHQMTFELSQALKQRLGDENVSRPHTNLLLLQCPPGKSVEIAGYAEARGVRILPFGSSTIRLAIHAGVTRDNLLTVVQSLATAWEAARALGVRAPAI